jgi:hypothetical protein
MIIVADTSPINYLVLIKEIEVLPRLSPRLPGPRLPSPVAQPAS